MIRRICWPTIILVSVASLALPAHAADKPAVAAARALSDAFVSVSQQVKPAVVSVHAEKTVKFRRDEWQFPFGECPPFRWFFDDGGEPHPRRPQQREFRFKQGGLGSGIIIDKDGHILTNNHVVQDVDEIRVTLADKREFKAEIVGTDPKTDLAVIKIKDKVPRDLPVAKLGDSDAVRVGECALAIGAPFGYEQTVTAGIISAKGRANVGATDYEDFIQTDAAINPGNSGGPLVNLDGEVVGINTVIATSVGQYSGVGFAIPINMAKTIMPTLLKGGTVSRGMLGVIIQDITEDLREQFNLPDTKGALVAQINKDSPAEKAGIKVGDVILRFNGTPIDDTRHLRNLVAATAPGIKVEIVFLRDGKERTVKVTLAELQGKQTRTGKGEEREEGANTPDVGLTVEALSADKAKELGYENAEGVLITDVDEGSPAAEADLEPNDLITEVNHEKVTSVDGFRNAPAK